MEKHRGGNAIYSDGMVPQYKMAGNDTIHMIIFKYVAQCIHQQIIEHQCKSF